MKEAILYGVSYALGLLSSFIVGYTMGQRDLNRNRPRETDIAPIKNVKLARHPRHKPVTISEEVLWQKERDDAGKQERTM